MEKLLQKEKNLLFSLVFPRCTDFFCFSGFSTGRYPCGKRKKTSYFCGFGRVFHKNKILLFRFSLSSIYKGSFDFRVPVNNRKKSVLNRFSTGVEKDVEKPNGTC